MSINVHNIIEAVFVSIQRGSYKSGAVCERGLYRSTIADSRQCEIVSRIRFRVHHALCSNIAELDNNEDIARARARVCMYVCVCIVSGII